MADREVSGPVFSLSAAQARELVLRAQGFCSQPGGGPLAPGAARAGGGPAVGGVLESLGAVQLDTIAVLARSHELVAYSRLGPVGRAAVESALWGGRPAAAFEYWAHALCVVPVAAWPYFAFRRREALRSGRGERVSPQALADVRARLRDGPVTATELGGAAQPGRWAVHSPGKAAVEWLCRTGEAVCAARRGWKRVYDLPERVLPAEVLGKDLSDEECTGYLVRRAVAAMGVATRQDIADYYHLRLREADRGLRDSGALPVRVEGWDDAAWADPAGAAASPAAPRRVTLVSPFDSLIWERTRMRRIFGVAMLLEAYRPKAERDHGYFTMPVLAGGALVGLVDPAKSGTTLAARHVRLDDPAHIPAMKDALVEAATWVGCDRVVIERASPQAIAEPLNRALENPA